MNPISVAVDVDAEREGRISEVVASLPVSLMAGAGTGPADVAAVSGAPGWAARATSALDGGARAVLVTAPVAEPVDELDRLAAAPVFLDQPWVGSPALPDVAAALAGLPTAGRTLEVHAVVDGAIGLDRALLAQLTLCRRVLGPVGALRVLAWTGAGYLAEGELATGQKVLVGCRTSSVRTNAATLRLIGPQNSVSVSLPAGSAAWPARVVVSDTEGATLLPTRYETQHRAVWRRIVAVLRSESAAPTDVADFAEDLRWTAVPQRA